MIRADVLSALALAARGREPLPAGLARLAETDQALTGRLVPIERALRAGHPLAEVLRSQRVLSRAEAEELRLSPDTPETLERLAQRQPPAFPWFLRHLPLSVALLTLVPSCACALGLMLLQLLDLDDANSLVALARMEVGGSIMDGTIRAVVLVFGCILAALALAELLAYRVPIFPALSQLFCRSVLEQEALLRLVRTVRSRDDRRVSHHWPFRYLSLIWLWRGMQGKPVWHADWALWWRFARFRVPPATRSIVVSLPDLGMRLSSLGILPQNESGEGWADAERICEERLAHAVAMQRILTLPILTLCGLFGIISAITLPYSPILAVFSSDDDSDGRFLSSIQSFWLHRGLESILIPLGAVILLMTLRYIIRSSRIGISGISLRLLSQTIARYLHLRLPISAALEDLRMHLNSLTDRRLSAVIRDCQRQPAASPIGLLTGRGLIPRHLGRLALSAEALGPAVLEGFFTTLSRPLLLTERLTRRHAPAIVTSISIVFVTIFCSMYIEPKFEAIFRDLSIELPTAFIAWSFVVHHWFILSLPVIALGLSLALWSSWLRAVQRRHELRANIVVLGVESHIPVDRIAEALSVNLPDPTFPALCRACGWDAHTPNDLASQLVAHQKRRERRAIWLNTVFEMTAPLVLGSVVLLVCCVTYGPLIEIIRNLAKEI